MRAVRQHAYDEPLVVEEVDQPTIGAGESLVTITYGAVNPLDVWIANGAVAAAGPLPRTPGCEGVGTTATGARVAFRGAGCGLVRDGSWAEQVAVPDIALAAIPAGCSDAQAAALGIPGVTAYDCLEVAIPLDRMNAPPQSILDPLLREGAVASAEMNFKEVDRAPEDVLNRILWHARQGSGSPYPEWAVGSDEDDDDDD